jgi:hypothetical protein
LPHEIILRCIAEIRAQRALRGAPNRARSFDELDIRLGLLCGCGWGRIGKDSWVAPALDRLAELALEAQSFGAPAATHVSTSDVAWLFVDGPCGGIGPPIHEKTDPPLALAIWEPFPLMYPFDWRNA